MADWETCIRDKIYKSENFRFIARYNQKLLKENRQGGTPPVLIGLRIKKNILRLWKPTVLAKAKVERKQL